MPYPDSLNCRRPLPPPVSRRLQTAQCSYGHRSLVPYIYTVMLVRRLLAAWCRGRAHRSAVRRSTMRHGHRRRRTRAPTTGDQATRPLSCACTTPCPTYESTTPDTAPRLTGLAHCLLCPSVCLSPCCDKLAFHDADTDTDILADIIARIVARMPACRSACHRNNSRKSRVSDVSARILAMMSVSMSVSASWNASLTTLQFVTGAHIIDACR